MKPITEANDYRTTRKRPILPVRLIPSLVFYTGILRTIWRSICLAKIGRYDSDTWARCSRRILYWLESVGCRVSIENLNGFRRLQAPCVFIGNHMSTLETFVLPGLIQPVRDVTFVVKQSLVAYPYFKHVMLSRDPVVVTRTHPREDLKHVLEEGTLRLKNGISIIVFPQTTRSFHTRIEKFNSIGVKLAKHAGVPVVPFALRTDAWANGRLIKDIGRIDPQRPVHFAFGNPLNVEGSGKETHLKIIDFISEKLNLWFP